MSASRSFVIVSCLAPLLGCGATGQQDDSTGGDLKVLAANEKSGLEARYTEGGHTLVLRSRPLGSDLQSELLDGDLSIGARAREIVGRDTGFRTAAGQPVVAVRQRFADAQSLSRALRLARHALRQMHETLPQESTDTRHLEALEKEISPIRKALARTRLLLLDEWVSESRRQLHLTPEEHTRFFAVFDRRARQIVETGGPPPGAKRARMKKLGLNGGGAPPSRVGEEIQTLLGPERYQKYLTLRTTWIASNGGDDAEVLP